MAGRGSLPDTPGRCGPFPGAVAAASLCLLTRSSKKQWKIGRRAPAGARGPPLLLLVLVPGRLGLRRDLAEAGQVFRLHLGRGAVLAPDGVVNFLAVDADLFRGGDPQTHLVAADVYHGDLDVVPDHDRLIALPG